MRVLEGANFEEATERNCKIHCLRGSGNEGPEIMKHKGTYIFRREQTVLRCVSR
jgi:hypothetical protein